MACRLPLGMEMRTRALLLSGLITNARTNVRHMIIKSNFSPELAMSKAERVKQQQCYVLCMYIFGWLQPALIDVSSSS